MSFLKGMLNEWRAKTPAEKIKTILRLAANTGAGIIGSDIATRAAAGKGPLSKVCAAVAGAGLGIAAGDVASKALDETVDTFKEIADMRKEMKEEDAANA